MDINYAQSDDVELADAIAIHIAKHIAKTTDTDTLIDIERATNILNGISNILEEKFQL